MEKIIIMALLGVNVLISLIIMSFVLMYFFKNRKPREKKKKNSTDELTQQASAQDSSVSTNQIIDTGAAMNQGYVQTTDSQPIPATEVGVNQVEQSIVSGYQQTQPVVDAMNIQQPVMEQNPAQAVDQAFIVNNMNTAQQNENYVAPQSAEVSVKKVSSAKKKKSKPAKKAKPQKKASPAKNKKKKR